MISTVATAVILTGAAAAFSISWSPPTEDGKLRVVATFYPLAYFAQAIGKEHVSVRSLLPYNTELHAWTPLASDILAVQESDVFIYNGAGLEPWVERDILPAIAEANKIIVDATDGLDLSPVEGQDMGDRGQEDEHALVDPHTWLDPVLAQGEAEAILEAFEEADPANVEAYRVNAQQLFERFEAVDAAFKSELASRRLSTIIVAHDAFGYLGHRYGFEVVGIIGLSADEQPSTSVMVEILDLMSRDDISTLYVTPLYTGEYVRALEISLEEQSGREATVLTLYTLTGPVDGMDYFVQMDANLESLKLGLEA